MLLYHHTSANTGTSTLETTHRNQPASTNAAAGPALVMLNAHARPWNESHMRVSGIARISLTCRLGEGACALRRNTSPGPMDSQRGMDAKGPGGRGRAEHPELGLQCAARRGGTAPKGRPGITQLPRRGIATSQNSGPFGV